VGAIPGRRRAADLETLRVGLLGKKKAGFRRVWAAMGAGFSTEERSLVVSTRQRLKDNNSRSCSQSGWVG